VSNSGHGAKKRILDNLSETESEQQRGEDDEIEVVRQTKDRGSDYDATSKWQKVKKTTSEQKTKCQDKLAMIDYPSRNSNGGD